jgi:hypothetical protein
MEILHPERSLKEMTYFESDQAAHSLAFCNVISSPISIAHSSNTHRDGTGEEGKEH